MGKCDIGGRKGEQILSGKDMGFGISENRLPIFSIFSKGVINFRNQN